MQETNPPRFQLPTANCLLPTSHRRVSASAAHLRIRTRLQTCTRLRLALCLLLAFNTLLAGCIFPRRTPNLQRIFADARARTGKRPLIVIPGILGSQLVNEKTGEVVWPSAFRSSDDGLGLPISTDLEHNRDNLVSRKIIDTAKLAKLTPEVYVYHELLVALKEYGGYKEGDWDNPGTDGDRDTFYVFPYDWRRDNVETARLLIEKIEALKRKLNRPDLRFNILAHSMGGLVARYAAMYGGADLQPEGVQPVPTWAGAADINRIVMLGTPNEGSTDAFATLLYGYSITEGLRRRIPLLNKLTSEDVFTAPSVYQLLPDRAATHFLDENLQPVEVDLYDPATWKRYGWSPVNNADYRDRFVKGEIHGDGAPQHAGTLTDLDDYFALVLNRAKRFHEALDVTVMDAPIQLFALGGDCEDTLSAPILLFDQKRQRWETLIRPRSFLTSGGLRVTHRQAAQAMSAPGDGRVTRRSLLGEDLAGARFRNSLLNTTLPIIYAVFACDLHGALQSNKMLQDNALTALVNEVMK